VPAGFNTPGLLFVGSSSPGELAYAGAVLRKLHAAGSYDLYIEPCVGGYNQARSALEAGFQPNQMETSDVTLYSSVLGYLLSKQSIAELDVRIDGEPVPMEGEPLEQAARILVAHLIARVEARPQVDYWQELLHDLQTRTDAHEAAVRKKLEPLVGMFRGVKYERLDLMEHMLRHRDNPKAIVHAVPPTYTEGYEKFFDTKGRLTWNEPEYPIFDVEAGWKQMWDEFHDAKCLFLGMRECEPGKCPWPKPVFANHQRAGQYAYYVTNRPDEVLGLMGGFKVRPKPKTEWAPLPNPILPYDYEITEKSRLEVIPIPYTAARWYRGLWMHRITSSEMGTPWAVLVDNHVAGVASFSSAPILNPYRIDQERSAKAIMLRFASGAPHKTFRLGRLVTKLGLQRGVLDVVLLPTPTGGWVSAIAENIVTAEMTARPEVKGLRGLMKLVERRKGPDGFHLVYMAAIEKLSYGEVLEFFLRKERQWQKNTTKGRPTPGSTSGTEPVAATAVGE
jgi:hypothetical protein